MDQLAQAQFDQSDLETTPCPLCGSAGFREEIDFSPFTVVQCQECELFISRTIILTNPQRAGTAATSNRSWLCGPLIAVFSRD